MVKRFQETPIKIQEEIQTFDSKNAKIVRIFADQQPLASENDLKGCSGEPSYGMLLYLVKRKLEERFLYVSIFHKTASTMNLTGFSILNLINAMLHNIL